MSKWFIIIAICTCWIVSCSNTTGSPPVYTLETSTEPENAGTVTPDGGRFGERDEIELRAEPAEGYLFKSWSGDLSGSENPDLLMFNGDKKVTAVFDRKEYKLHIGISGEGSVREEIVESPAKSDYEYGTTVQLTAEPEDGWQFERWEGDLSGQENPSSLIIEVEKTITAHFSVEMFTMDLAVEGSGEVVLDPEKSEYQPGEVVTITAEPAEGWIFNAWEGDFDSADDSVTADENHLIIRMHGNRKITAIFEEIVIEYLSHGYTEGVSPADEPRFLERTYPVIRANWEGPGGDKRWLGRNLGAADAPASYDDRTAHHAGWYFKFNDLQGYFHEGYNPEAGFYAGDDPVPAPFSSTERGDPCTELLGDNWRIPSSAEWRAVNEAGAATLLNLHAGGNITSSSGITTHNGLVGSYWSSTAHEDTAGSATQGIAFHTEKISGNINLRSSPEPETSGLTIRCIGE